MKYVINNKKKNLNILKINLIFFNVMKKYIFQAHSLLKIVF